MLDILEKEVKLAKRRAEELRVVANEVSKTARSSWSAAGERFLTQGQAQAAEEYFKRMLDLIGKIEGAVKEPTPDSVVTSCFVKLILDGREEEFYLAEEVVSIPGVKLVSKSSLLGKSLLGKKVNETFSFETVEGKKVEGKIIYLG